MRSCGRAARDAASNGPYADVGIMCALMRQCRVIGGRAFEVLEIRHLNKIRLRRIKGPVAAGANVCAGRGKEAFGVRKALIGIHTGFALAV